MEKKITRTFKFSKVEIKDSKTGELLDTQVTEGIVSREKIAIKFIKATGNTSFVIDVVETEELREMTLEVFVAHSTIATPRVDNPTPTPTPVENIPHL